MSQVADSTLSAFTANTMAMATCCSAMAFKQTVIGKDIVSGGAFALVSFGLGHGVMISTKFGFVQLKWK
jgi:hypothetical protein